MGAGHPAPGLAWGTQDGHDAIQGLQDPGDGPRQRVWQQLGQGPTVMDDQPPSCHKMSMFFLRMLPTALEKAFSL